MASITKRKYWVDPVSRREVPRDTPGAVPRTSRYWRIRVVLPSGKILSRRGYVDKLASEQLAAQLEREAAGAEDRTGEDRSLARLATLWQVLPDVHRGSLLAQAEALAAEEFQKPEPTKRAPKKRAET